MTLNEGQDLIQKRLTPEQSSGRLTAAATAGIEAMLDELAETVRAGQLEKIMSFYADDFVAFDMMPPLQFKDKDEYRTTAWQECFTDYFKFPVMIHHHERQVHAAGDLALVHYLMHMQGESKTGKKMESWLRSTLALRQMEGEWKIIHEHNSVPLDKDGTQGLMNLKPESVGNESISSSSH